MIAMTRLFGRCRSALALRGRLFALLLLLCAVVAFFACAGNVNSTDPDGGNRALEPIGGEEEQEIGDDYAGATQALCEHCVHELKFELKDGKRQCHVVASDDLDISSAWLVFLNSSGTARSGVKKPKHSVSVRLAEQSGVPFELSSSRDVGSNAVPESSARRHKSPRRVSLDYDTLRKISDFESGECISSRKADSDFSKSDSVLKGKTISENDEPLAIGSVRTFKVYYDSVIDSEEFKSGYREVSAELKHLSRKQTDNGERTLLLYLQEGLKDAGNIPSAEDFALISDCFFDVMYPLATQVFGNDEGKVTGNPDKTESEWSLDNFITNTDELAVLFCDIDDQGPDFKEGYVYGFFDQSNYIKPEAMSQPQWNGYETNGIPLICIHAYKAGGDDLGTSLLTMLHEFQHLIHSQHLGELASLSSLKVSKPDVFIDELFSLAIEELAAKRLIEYAKEKHERDLIVEDPFCVLSNAHGLEFGVIGSTERAGDEIFKKGKGPYVLDSFGYDITAWHSPDDASNENERKEADRKQLVDYGRAAAFAHYILLNYGIGCFKEYLDKAVPGFNRGLMPAIASVINAERAQSGGFEQASSSYDIASFMKDFAIAALMSGVSGTCAPISFNKASFVEVAGMKVPSVNLHQYYANGSGARGIRNSHILNGEAFDGFSINYYSVLQDVAELNKGDTIAITLDSSLSSYVDALLVLVPSNASVLDFKAAGNLNQPCLKNTTSPSFMR